MAIEVGLLVMWRKREVDHVSLGGCGRIPIRLRRRIALKGGLSAGGPWNSFYPLQDARCIRRKPVAVEDTVPAAAAAAAADLNCWTLMSGKRCCGM